MPRSGRVPPKKKHPDTHPGPSDLARQKRLLTLAQAIQDLRAHGGTQREILRLEARMDALTVRAKKAQRITVMLHYRHYLNGIVYGPGPITGPIDLCQQLAENDGRARLEEDECNDRNGRAYVIGFPVGGGLTKRPVPYESFDTSMRMADPGIRVSGRGMG